MKTYDKNYLSELVTQFVDGEISPSDESILQEALANDTELMEQLKFQLNLKELVKNDVEAFTPPSTAAKGIFNSLGYSSPYNTAIVNPNRWKTFFKIGVPLALLMLSSLLLYNLFDNQTNIESKTNSQNSNLLTKEQITDNNELQTNPNQIPVVENKEIKVDNLTKLNLNNKKADVIVKKINESSNNKTITEKFTLNDSFNNNESQIKVLKVNLSNFILKKYNFELGRFNNVNSTFSEPNYLYGGFGDTYLKLYVRNSQSNNINELFSNTTVGFSFLSKDNFRGGFEVGTQNYNVIISDINEQLITENRNILWYAATVRYEIKELSIFDIEPFAQISLGSGDFGKYMFRYMIGLEYMPFANGIGFSAGYEASTLWYSTQNVNYSTKNNGFTLGISWKF